MSALRWGAVLALVVGATIVSACNTEPDAAPGGGAAGAAGRPGAPADDPCDVVGTWTNGCGEVAMCGPCEGSSLPLGQQFTITDTVAKRGGTLEVGAATFVFDPGTCTLKSSNQFCTPWTDDTFELRAGAGTGEAFAHCAAGGETCDCQVRTTCRPRRLR